jgi:hypothetical protein
VSEYEPVLRRTRELEAKIRDAEGKIKAEEEIMPTIAARYPYFTPREVLLVDAEYRTYYFSRLSLLGWIKKWKEMLAELRKVIPPVEFHRIILTFSIETGRGHSPFFAEVTCDTVWDARIPVEEENNRIRRIINAAIKIFWVCFDVWKDLIDDMRELWGAEVYDPLFKKAEAIQKGIRYMDEEWLDEYYKALIKLGCLTKPVEQYVTQEAIIKIGLEVFPATREAKPRYPEVNVTIEKESWVIERKIIIADKTDIDILELLDMEVEV